MKPFENAFTEEGVNSSKINYYETIKFGLQYYLEKKIGVSSKRTNSGLKCTQRLIKEQCPLLIPSSIE